MGIVSVFRPSIIEENSGKLKINTRQGKSLDIGNVYRFWYFILASPGLTGTV